MKRLLLSMLLCTGCVHYVTTECPTCRVLHPRHTGREPALPTIKPGTKRLFVVVPGGLGYSWEWTPAVTRLAGVPDAEFVVYWWEPYGTLDAARKDLVRYVNDLITPVSPRALEEVVIVAHSIGGIVAAHAAHDLRPPSGVHVRVATIGTPFAGMVGAGYADVLSSIGLFSVYAPWLRYPAPADGVEIIEYRTSWPDDPVMKPRLGHQPAPPGIGPQPRRTVQLPRMDHNACVDLVVQRLVDRVD